MFPLTLALDLFSLHMVIGEAVLYRAVVANILRSSLKRKKFISGIYFEFKLGHAVVGICVTLASFQHDSLNGNPDGSSLGFVAAPG